MCEIDLKLCKVNLTKVLTRVTSCKFSVILNNFKNFCIDQNFEKFCLQPIDVTESK